MIDQESSRAFRYIDGTIRVFLPCSGQWYGGAGGWLCRFMHEALNSIRFTNKSVCNFADCAGFSVGQTTEILEATAPLRAAN